MNHENINYRDTAEILREDPIKPDMPGDDLVMPIYRQMMLVDELLAIHVIEIVDGT